MGMLLKEQPSSIVENEPLLIRNGIVLEMLNEQDVGGVIHCLTTTFLTGEPMTRSLGISPRAFQDFADLICTKAVSDGLSVVAKDRSTGMLVGCLISEDMNSEPPQGLDSVHSDFDPILVLLATLGDNYKKPHPYFRNNLFHEFMMGVYHEFMMGVYPEYKGRNIGYHLVEASHALGRMKGFKATIAEVTGPISQRIFIDKHHYQVIDAIKYKDFKFQGKCCFESISDCDSCQLVYKDLYAGIEKGWEHT